MLAAAPGTVSSTEDAAPAPLRLPATTPCSCRAAVAALKLPDPPLVTSTAAVTGTLAVSSTAEPVLPTDARANEEADSGTASTACDPIGSTLPCGVRATTFTWALALPGTTMNTRTEPLPAGRPGMTMWVEGATAGGSQLPRAPAADAAHTAAATRPRLVCTLNATVPEPLAYWASDSVTRPCGGTVIPLSALPATTPESVITLTSTVAGWLSVFI